MLVLSNAKLQKTNDNLKQPQQIDLPLEVSENPLSQVYKLTSDWLHERGSMRIQENMGSLR